MSCVFFLLMCTISTHLLHTSETSSTIPQPRVQRELTDAELKQFGENCNKLPYALWGYALDFLLGDHHEIIFGVDPQSISNLQQSNRVKIDDYGRLVACYNNNIYAWNPCGNHIAPKKSWYTQAIPKGWSLDRFENGSIVLLNDDHNEITVLDDMTFKQQSHYRLPQNSYFLVAKEGHTLVHCAHPLLTKAPILNMHIVTQQHGELDAKIQQSSQLIRMPQGGVMPPIALDESGTVLVVHATERDELHVIDLQVAHRSSSPLPRNIVLSDRSINVQGAAAAEWTLKNPATGICENFRLSLRTGFLNQTASPVVAIGPTKNPYGVPLEPLHFQQVLPPSNMDYRCTGEINFIKGESQKKGHVIASLSSQADCSESEGKKKVSATYVFQYWNSATGDCLRSLRSTSKDNGIPHYGISRSGRIALCNDTECDLLTPPSNMRSLFSDKNDGQVGRVRISPSGDWVFHYYHMMSRKSSYILMLPMIHYLGGERMKKIKGENSKIDRRKWMMRLYALQRAWERTEELQPPQEMQDALGMKFASPHKYDKGPTSKNRDKCIIS